MSISRDPLPPAAAPPPGVSFEVERFEWVDGIRLEVAGRWFGIRGRRFLRPTLDVEVDGTPRRMLALLEHKPWAADDGEEWIAAFAWAGEPVELAAAELAVAPELAVELPAPSGAPPPKKRRARAGRRLEARPPRTQALEAELAAARAEIEELRGRLAAEQRARENRAEQVKELREERAADHAGTARLEEARDAALAERDAARGERDAALAGRDEALAARDAAIAEAAKATSDREQVERGRAAIERELEAAVRARDKARHERNEWLTRARAAADKAGPAGREAAPPAKPTPPAAAAPPAPAPAPPPASAPPPAPRRRPGKPARAPLPPGGILMPPTGPGSNTRRSILPAWAPRVLAPVALVVLLVVVALLIAWAF